MAWVKDDWGRLAKFLGGATTGYLGQREKERAHGLREREVTSAEERAASYIEALNQQTEAGRFRQQQDVQAANWLQRPMGEAFADPSQVPAARMGELQQYQTGQRAGEQFGWQQELAAHEALQRERAQEPISQAVMGLFDDEQIPEGMTREEFSQVLPYITEMGALERRAALKDGGGPGFEPAMGNFMLKLEGNMRERALSELLMQDKSQGGTLEQDLSGAGALRDPMTGDLNWERVAQLLGPQRWRAFTNMSRQMTDQWLMDQIGFEGEGVVPGEEIVGGEEDESSEIIQSLETRIAELEAEKKKPLPTDAQLRDWYLAQHPALGSPQPGMAPEIGALAQDPAAMLTLARSEWEQQPAGAGFAVLGKPGEQRARAAQQKAQKTKQTQAQKLRQAALKKKRVGVRAGGRAGIAAGGRAY